MRISNRFTGWLHALLLAAPSAGADDITLAAGNSRLSGEVRAIHEDGAIELASPLSPQPLHLKNGTVRKVEFTALPTDARAPGAIIGLANGDLLPATLEALDKQTLTATTPHAGRLSIPRAALSSLQLGVRENKLVYSGPGKPEDWKGIDGPLKNLRIDGGALVANGQAYAVRDIGLPEDFIIRFTLIWQERQMPNFQVYFADPLQPRGEAVDRYDLRFNGAGIGIKREAADGKRYNDIITLNRTPNLFPECELDVEVHVSRSTSRLKLFLNGEPEDEGEDHLASIPKGGGIAIVSNASTGNIQRVRDIRILELDDSRTRHGAEDRGDGKQDSLISRDDDRWGGALTEIRPAASGPVFVFKSDFQNEPLEIPETDVSTVFFAKPAGEAGAAPAYRLRLRDGGSLAVSSCRFDGDAVTASHPLLGELRLARSGLLAFEIPGDDKPAKPEQ
jgi:hypothetical protein